MVQAKSRTGFTLVELAIVIVIVGLLTGGVLIAQSMVRTVKVNRLISNLGQYEIAIRNFEYMYNSVPGDAPFFMPAGNNNKRIDNTAACTSEIFQVYAHLSQAKMIAVNYVPFTPSGLDQFGNNGNYGACSGPHTYPTEASMPYTELEKPLDAHPFTKWEITLNTRLNTFLDVRFFTLIVAPYDSIAITSKLGSDLITKYNTGNHNASLPPPGLYTGSDGPGQCVAADNSESLECTDADAVADTLYLFLQR